MCELCDGPSSQCRKDLKSPHDEAELIATVYKRFDYDLVHLKNPTIDELEAVWRTIE